MSESKASVRQSSRNAEVVASVATWRDVTELARGSIVVPFLGGSYLESYKVIPKSNYYGACGYTAEFRDSSVQGLGILGFGCGVGVLESRGARYTEAQELLQRKSFRSEI